MGSRFLFGALAVVVVIVIYDAVIIARALLAGGQLAEQSTPYGTPPTALSRSAAGDAKIERVLVVGDSTAVGTGAGDPAKSVPGRLARDYPAVVVENRAEDGARTAAVLDQLGDATADHYSLVLILVGGNDVLQLTGVARLRESIRQVLRRATAVGEHVVLMTVGDVGGAPAIPWPVSALFSYRAAQLRRVFADEAAQRGVTYLDMYRSDPRRDPFARDPGTFYARDGLHPSADGYGLWYRQLEREAPLQRWLTGS